ncbi:MAG: hypothetical protein JSS36_03385 [Proteobacteria bacterium]|nr:hypothetical protein [Pseudomonadota bacterium]
MRLQSTIAPHALGAALTIALAATPGAALAKSARHAAHKAATPAGEGQLTLAEQLAMAQQQIAQMQAQLNALQARLDGQASAAPQMAQATQAAQTRADEAQATATKALAVAEKAQTGVVKADRAVAAVKWAADTRVSGRMYFNISTINQQNSGTKTAASGTGLNIKRMYLGVDHRFSDRFAMNVTADIANVLGQTANANFATPAANTGTGAISNVALVGKGFYVKKAYLEARLDPALWIRVGAADLPWVPYIENQNGYRHIDNVLTDRLGYGTSADWGVHIGGDLANKLISYQVSLIDGAGYRNVRVTNSIDVEGRVSVNYHGLWGAVGGYIGKLGNNVQAATPTTFHTASRVDLAAGFRNEKLGLGIEYFYARNWKNVTTNPATTAYSEEAAKGTSIFGNYTLAPKWSIFGKYEWARPNDRNVPSVNDNYFNIGLQWEPVKIVDLALVYKREIVNNGAISTQNGLIGCAPVATASAFATAAALAAAPCAGNGTYDEVGIFGQVRF